MTLLSCLVFTILFFIHIFMFLYIAYYIAIIGGQYRGTKVPRYFLGTGTAVLLWYRYRYRGTFVVPVPRYFAIFWRYRYFSFVLFFSRDFTNVIKNLKRGKNACE